MIHSAAVQKTFCTTREAASILGISLRTAQLWVESGLLEAWKTEGGHRRISRQSIEKLLVSPPNRQTMAEPEPAAMTRPAGSRLSILVVEDEAALRRVYELTLARWPMQPRVSTAGDGYEALLRIGLARPDMVISDLRMPGMDGFRMLQALKEQPELADMTLVVVTGLHPEEIADQGGVPEGIPVLPKPIPFQRLLTIAEEVHQRLLSRSSTTRQR
ncbi:MAG: response regulator [Dechloromonas sp.]|nr:MAG: response regulator [Dechloromonas sp.]